MQNGVEVWKVGDVLLHRPSLEDGSRHIPREVERLREEIRMLPASAWRYLAAELFNAVGLTQPVQMPDRIVVTAEQARSISDHFSKDSESDAAEDEDTAAHAVNPSRRRSVTRDDDLSDRT